MKYLEWWPFTYYGFAVATNLFTLALITEAAYAPATPEIGKLARFTYGLGIMLTLFNFYWMLKD